MKLKGAFGSPQERRGVRDDVPAIPSPGSSSSEHEEVQRVPLRLKAVRPGRKKNNHVIPEVKRQAEMEGQNRQKEEEAEQRRRLCFRISGGVAVAILVVFCLTGDASWWSLIPSFSPKFRGSLRLVSTGVDEGTGTDSSRSVASSGVLVVNDESASIHRNANANTNSNTNSNRNTNSNLNNIDNHIDKNNYNNNINSDASGASSTPDHDAHIHDRSNIGGNTSENANTDSNTHRHDVVSIRSIRNVDSNNSEHNSNADVPFTPAHKEASYSMSLNGVRGHEITGNPFKDDSSYLETDLKLVGQARVIQHSSLLSEEVVDDGAISYLELSFITDKSAPGGRERQSPSRINNPDRYKPLIRMPRKSQEVTPAAPLYGRSANRQGAAVVKDAMQTLVPRNPDAILTPPAARETTTVKSNPSNLSTMVAAQIEENQKLQKYIRGIKDIITNQIQLYELIKTVTTPGQLNLLSGDVRSRGVVNGAIFSWKRDECGRKIATLMTKIKEWFPDVKGFADAFSSEIEKANIPFTRFAESLQETGVNVQDAVKTLQTDAAIQLQELKTKGEKFQEELVNNFGQRVGVDTKDRTDYFFSNKLLDNEVNDLMEEFKRRRDCKTKNELIPKPNSPIITREAKIADATDIKQRHLLSLGVQLQNGKLEQLNFTFENRFPAKYIPRHVRAMGCMTLVELDHPDAMSTLTGPKRLSPSALWDAGGKAALAAGSKLVKWKNDKELSLGVGVEESNDLKKLMEGVSQLLLPEFFRGDEKHRHPEAWLPFHQSSSDFLSKRPSRLQWVGEGTSGTSGPSRMALGLSYYSAGDAADSKAIWMDVNKVPPGADAAWQSAGGFLVGIQVTINPPISHIVEVGLFSWEFTRPRSGRQTPSTEGAPTANTLQDHFQKGQVKLELRLGVRRNTGSGGRGAKTQLSSLLEWEGVSPEYDF